MNVHQNVHMNIYNNTPFAHLTCSYNCSMEDNIHFHRNDHLKVHLIVIINFNMNAHKDKDIHNFSLPKPTS